MNEKCTTKSTRKQCNLFHLFSRILFFFHDICSCSCSDFCQYLALNCVFNKLCVNLRMWLNLFGWGYGLMTSKKGKRVCMVFCEFMIVLVVNEKSGGAKGVKMTPSMEVFFNFFALFCKKYYKTLPKYCCSYNMVPDVVRLYTSCRILKKFFKKY